MQLLIYFYQHLVQEYKIKNSTITQTLHYDVTMHYYLIELDKQRYGAPIFKNIQAMFNLINDQ